MMTDNNTPTVPSPSSGRWDAPKKIDLTYKPAKYRVFDEAGNELFANEQGQYNLTVGRIVTISNADIPDTPSGEIVGRTGDDIRVKRLQQQVLELERELAEYRAIDLTDTALTLAGVAVFAHKLVNAIQVYEAAVFHSESVRVQAWIAVRQLVAAYRRQHDGDPTNDEAQS
jgi:hypothetical protein